MHLTYNDLNSCIEAMRTAAGQKQVASNIIIKSCPSKKTLTFVAIEAVYQVVKSISPIFEDTDVEAEILVNFKKLGELTAIAKPMSGIETNINWFISPDRKELNFKISKQTKEKKLLSRITHYLPFTYVAEDKRRGGLDAVNIDWLLSLADDSSENENTTVWERENLLTTFSKLITGDATQIIMSNQVKAIATCHSNFAVYKEDPTAAITVVLQTNIAKRIIDVFKSSSSSHIILHKYDNRLAILDTDGQTAIQTEIPTAKKLLVNHINGFNSADYSHGGAVIHRNILIDIIKCFETLTGVNRADMKFIRTDEDNWQLKFETPDSTNRQNDMQVTIESMREQTDIVNKPFKVALDTLLQMLNTCNTQQVVLSIAMPDEEGQVQSLLKIASLLDNNTEGLKTYSILENEEPKEEEQ